MQKYKCYFDLSNIQPICLNCQKKRIYKMNKLILLCLRIPDKPFSIPKFLNS